MWIIWLLLTLGIAGYYSFQMLFGVDKTEFLIGETTYGHYQIELACETCHTSPFGGEEILQNACLNCHAEELDMVNDSHPKSKFTDPRNADLLEIIDARYCVTCHTEHHRDKTLEMGLTLPKDYCFHCHENIDEERETHKDLAFDSCASAGCHNYHDNRALYEGFLLRHNDEPVFKAIAKIPALTGEKTYRENNPNYRVLEASDVNYLGYSGTVDDAIVHQWVASAHGRNGIECVDCHVEDSNDSVWIEQPNHNQCRFCHSEQTKGFSEGKHGMRLADTLSKPLQAISPSESELSFKESALYRQHSCSACHSSHDFNTKTAAVDACLSCHNDEHSVAYVNSPHHELWLKELTGELFENSGVSCATCHMHREELIKGGGKSNKVTVVHNQNLTLRPNEKMIRPVCMNCHGLGFSIDALADKQLIKNNFNGRPSEHIPSIDMAIERDKQ